jgi:hypothetical protein
MRELMILVLMAKWVDGDVYYFQKSPMNEVDSRRLSQQQQLAAAPPPNGPNAYASKSTGSKYHTVRLSEPEKRGSSSSSSSYHSILQVGSIKIRMRIGRHVKAAMWEDILPVVRHAQVGNTYVGNLLSAKH